MDKKKKRDLISSYTTGSWNTYSFEEYNGPDFITVGTIVRGMRVFQRQFKMEVDVVPGSQLLFWTLTLEARHESPVTRSQRRLRRKTPIRTYKFAVCSDDNLLFSNKIISVSMTRQLSRAFSCTGLRPLKLTNGDPVNLLMMYRQSKKQSPDQLKLQHQEYLASLVDKVQHRGLMTSEDLAQEVAEAAKSKVFQSLGSQSDLIPRVQRVGISVGNVPNEEIPLLRNFRWPHIEAELYSSSVFHLHRELGMLKLITEVPEWLKKIRVSGKTEVQAKFV